eukprot:gene4410-6030_t
MPETRRLKRIPSRRKFKWLMLRKEAPTAYGIWRSVYRSLKISVYQLRASMLSNWAQPLIHFENVGLRYGMGPEILRDLTFDIPKRSFQFLTGPSGAGKTTLLRALAGLQPSRGSIHVAGAALSVLPLSERAKRFGYLPQGHVVHWPLPVKDVVALGRYPHGATDPARLAPADEAAVQRAMQ